MNSNKSIYLIPPVAVVDPDTDGPIAVDEAVMPRSTSFGSRHIRQHGDVSTPLDWPLPTKSNPRPLSYCQAVAEQVASAVRKGGGHLQDLEWGGPVGKKVLEGGEMPPEQTPPESQENGLPEDKGKRSHYPNLRNFIG